LAPGRIDFGVGTGFTGRRAMGLGAMKLAAMEDYIRVVYTLLAGDIVETGVDGRSRKIKFLNPELGLIKTDPSMPLHVSAYGPRSRALTAKLRAGWLNFIGDMSAGISAVGEMHSAWSDAGHARADLAATDFVLGCVLQDGEAYDSERAMAQAGPRAAVVLHRAPTKLFPACQTRAAFRRTRSTPYSVTSTSHWDSSLPTRAI
jgi:5,10-methylenetetrahydromethanopterin reductase